MAQYIAAKTAADKTGADITVGATPVKVSFYGNKGKETVGQVLEKSSDGTYTTFRSKIDESKAAVAIRLSNHLGSFSITAPGVYKIEKFETIGVAGIDVTE